MTTVGQFITVEGGEGAGKSTQVRRLRDWLADRRGIGALATREPGGSPGAEAIRGLLVTGTGDRWDPMTEALLHFAARRDHLRSVIWPALEAGTWVVCDRYVDSTRAYQGVALGLGIETVDALFSMIIDSFTPVLTIILDIPVELGLARADARGGGDRYERMGPVFHQRLREAFLAIAAAEPERCVVIDASADVETVHAAIVDAVTRRLHPGDD